MSSPPPQPQPQPPPYAESNQPSAPEPPSEPSPSEPSPPAEQSQPTTQLDNRITLRVRDENENEYAFMMKLTTPFKRIFDAFSQKVGVQLGTFRFHYDGLRLAREDTPGRIGVHENELIEAFVLAEGG